MRGGNVGCFWGWKSRSWVPTLPPNSTLQISLQKHLQREGFLPTHPTVGTEAVPFLFAIPSLSGVICPSSAAPAASFPASLALRVCGLASPRPCEVGRARSAYPGATRWGSGLSLAHLAEPDCHVCRGGSARSSRGCDPAGTQGQWSLWANSRPGE